MPVALLKVSREISGEPVHSIHNLKWIHMLVIRVCIYAKQVAFYDLAKDDSVDESVSVKRVSVDAVRLIATRIS